MVALTVVQSGASYGDAPCVVVEHRAAALIGRLEELVCLVEICVILAEENRGEAKLVCVAERSVAFDVEAGS